MTTPTPPCPCLHVARECAQNAGYFRIEAESCCKCLYKGNNATVPNPSEPVVGNGIPEADGAFDNQLYLNQADKTWYVWNAATSQWT